MFGVTRWMAVLTVAATPQGTDADLPALRGLRSETPDLAALTERALSGEEAHLHGNFCEGKSDGWRCKHDYVVLCQGGRTSSHEKCPFYQDCEEGMVNGTAVAFCEEDACEDKTDGLHCKHDNVVECAGGRTVNFTKCAFYQECKRDSSAQPSMAWCAEDACEDRQDGHHCKHDYVVECQNATTVNVSKCSITEECQSHALGRNRAACQEDDCRDRADGSYCEHDGVVQCEGGRSVSFSKCPFFQECQKSRSQPHTASCQEDACDEKADGWHCKSDHLVRCAVQQTVDVKMCLSSQSCDDEAGAPACM